MDLDIVERLMRHSGYLSSSYVRLTDEQVREAFHAGESALYITRADHRIQGSELAFLREKVKQLEQNQRAIETLDKIPLSETDKDDIAKRMFALQNQQKK
jgi:hypothetical protein